MKLIYINDLGKNSHGGYNYEFIFNNNISDVWGLDWEIKPASICNIEPPESSLQTTIKILKTNLILVLAQHNNCFSMQDCMDGIIPLCWEDISEYEEYPEEGRLVLPFGCDIEDVITNLNNKNLKFEENV